MYVAQEMFVEWLNEERGEGKEAAKEKARKMGEILGANSNQVDQRREKSKEGDQQCLMSQGLTER